MLNVFDSLPYFAWAVAGAGSIFTFIKFGTRVLHEDVRANLELWLEGSYESSWQKQFCEIFDAWFGREHLTWRCFAASSVASLLSVIFIWLLLDGVLGLLEVRSTGSLTLWQVLLLGSAINILPDYLSLLQTRFLFRVFESVSKLVAQFLLLVFDAALSGLIILGCISLWTYITGSGWISWIEIVAVFSEYSVFFFSTFLTSFLAWVFVASSFLMKVAIGFKGLLRYNEEPGEGLALIGAVCALGILLTVQPVFRNFEHQMSVVDTWLCHQFPDRVCSHLARLSDDEQQKVELLSKACGQNTPEDCFVEAARIQDIDVGETARMFELACRANFTRACHGLAAVLRFGSKEVRDPKAGLAVLLGACEFGDEFACSLAGGMLMRGEEVAQDTNLAWTLNQESCDNGDAKGCTNAGIMLKAGTGVQPDAELAFTLFQISCEAKEVEGCFELAAAYHKGMGVDADRTEALKYDDMACELGSGGSCYNIGRFLINESSAEEEEQIGWSKIARACQAGTPQACIMLQRAESTPSTLDEILKQCNQDVAVACLSLGTYHQSLRESGSQNRAMEAFRRSCELGDPVGCSSADRLGKN